LTQVAARKQVAGASLDDVKGDVDVDVVGIDWYGAPFR
jgi:hypothetical protein